MSRIIGIDYGKKRTGIAVTDMLQISINPLPTLQTENLKEFLFDYLKNNEVELIVLGYPTHADGNPTYITKDIDRLVKIIKKEFPNLPIEYVDEGFSSVDARNIMIQMGVKKKERQKKENIDKGSAILILKSYLDKKYRI